VAEVALGLNIEFVFLPAGTPKMNSIECLWDVIKRDFKSRLIQHKLVTIGQVHFEKLLQESLDAITPEAQQAAALHNNRHFMH